MRGLMSNAPNFSYPMRGTVVTTVHPEGLIMARVCISGLWDNISEDKRAAARRYSSSE